MRRSQGKKDKTRRVAIIGAGVAGCATAAALKDHGIDFVVYEKNSGPGGLWADNYPGAKVQSTFELYEFPCKKFPEHIRNRKDPPAPTATEVCTYLEEFIKEKGLKRHFRFNQRIEDVRAIADDEWCIEFSDGKMKSFSFVIICTGIVSVKPRIIEIPGKDDFEWNGGHVFHSSERRDENLFHGQKILVIGNGKSAVDAVTGAARIAKEDGSQPPLQVARRAAWYFPRHLLGILPYKYLFHSRLGSSLLPRYFENKSYLLVILHILFAPIKWCIWRIIELLLLLQYRLPWRLQPRMGTILRGALDVSVLITDESHLNKIRSGEIDMRIAKVEKLEPYKAILSTGEEEEVDVVVMATGWELSFDSFMDRCTTLDDLDVEEDGLWLYRNILPAKVKGIAFIGSNTLTFMNIYTSYIQAYWLAGLLAKKRKWPAQYHMTKTVTRDKEWRRKHYPQHVLRAASIEAYMQHYHDVLFQEMGARKPFHWLIRPLADFFVPVVPSLMKGMLEPTREEKKKMRRKDSGISVYSNMMESFKDECNDTDPSKPGVQVAAQTA